MEEAFEVTALAVARAVLGRLLGPPASRPERDPDEPRPMETLDDWILFGPRLR